MDLTKTLSHWAMNFWEYILLSPYQCPFLQKPQDQLKYRIGEILMLKNIMKFSTKQQNWKENLTELISINIILEMQSTLLNHSQYNYQDTSKDYITMTLSEIFHHQQLIETKIMSILRWNQDSQYLDNGKQIGIRDIVCQLNIICFKMLITQIIMFLISPFSTTLKIFWLRTIL